MNTLELKNNIFGMLVQIDNNDILSEIYDYVREFSVEKTVEKTVESNLSPEQEAELDKAILELNDSSTLIAHEDAMKMMQLW
jgi:hypothetical protein